MRIILLIGLLMITGSVKGQFPFEKYPAIKCKEYAKWIKYDKLELEHTIQFNLVIRKFYGKSDEVRVQLILNDSTDYSIVRIFRKTKQIQEIIERDAFYGITTPYSLYSADYNNDGLMDMKFLIPNHGCGAYNNYSRVVYLLQKKDGTFLKISYTDDFFEDETNRVERDVDGDGKFEIITQTFQRYGRHNYWLFNLYEVTLTGFKNVNYKAKYPIMVQLLNRENYTPTLKIPSKKIQRFSKKLPDDYRIE